MNNNTTDVPTTRLGGGDINNKCFLITNSNAMPDFNGYYVQKRISFFDTASMDLYMTNKFDSNPSYISDFQLRFIEFSFKKYILY